MEPERDLPFKVFSFMRDRIFLRREITYSKNSGRNLSNSILSKFYKFSSFVRGRTRVEQSRSRKNVCNSLLILFFCSTDSLNPLDGAKDLSRYSFILYFFYLVYFQFIFFFLKKKMNFFFVYYFIMSYFIFF